MPDDIDNESSVLTAVDYVPISEVQPEKQKLPKRRKQSVRYSQIPEHNKSKEESKPQITQPEINLPPVTAIQLELLKPNTSVEKKPLVVNEEAEASKR